jgi:hypothetical protein
MKKTPLNFSKFALLIDTSRVDSPCRGEFGTWDIRFVDISNGVDNLDYPDKWDATGKVFLDLAFHVQWTRNSEDKQTYAWRLSYDSTSVDSVEIAEAHLLMMKRIAKARQEQIVSPKTFGQFVTLLARGIGVKTFVRRGQPRETTSWRSLSDHYYSSHLVDDLLVHLIDHEIDKHFLSSTRSEVA